MTSTSSCSRRARRSGLAPEDYLDIEGVFNAISLADDRRLLIGAASRVDVYDPESLTLLRSIPAPEGFTETVAREDGVGGLLIGGRLGLARRDAETGELLWQRSTQRCWVARLVPERGTFCHHGAGQFEERFLSTGETTGASFATLSDETAGLEVIEGSREFVTFAHNDRASIWHWRIDGEPTITRPLAAGRIVIDGFGMGGDSIVTADYDPAEPGDPGARLLWDVNTDSAVGEPADDSGWLSDHVVERWTEAAASVLVDERTGRHFSVVREPGDTNAFSVHAGGAGPHAFVIEERRIVPIDPDTGEVDGAPIGFPEEVNLHQGVYSLSELAAPDRLAVTYDDPSVLTSVTDVFDLSDSTALARGLLGDLYSVVTADGDVISASAARLTRSSDTLEPRDAFAKSGASPTFMQTTENDETLLISGFDKNVSLFDLRDGRPIGDPIVTGVSQAQAWPAEFISADGQRMVTNSENGILLWDLAPDRLVEATCRMPGRELSEVEWSTYLGDEAQTPTCADVIG